MRGAAAINSQDNKPLQYSIKIKTVKKIFRLMATALALTAWSATAVAATLTEGFETKTTGSYNTTSVQGDACVWTLSDAGVFADKTNSNSGNNSLRLGNTAASYANMNANKSGGAGTVTFYAQTLHEKQHPDSGINCINNIYNRSYRMQSPHGSGRNHQHSRA